MTTTETNPKVYVGTYKKYNEGSLSGEWVDLTDFSSKDEFLEYCAELHSDEEYPEFMFQDWENDPGDYISQDDIDSELWDYLEELKGLSDTEIEAYQDYKNNFGKHATLEGFRDAYQGEFKDEEDFAYDLIEQCYDLPKMMGDLHYYFDYEKFARDLFISDYWMSDNGHVFRNC